jgi:hypothetical protein
MLTTVCRLVGLTIDVAEYRRSRRGWHVAVKVSEPLPPAEQVALQLALGSDNHREVLNLARIRGMRQNGATAFWRGRWNLLYGRKL